VATLTAPILDIRNLRPGDRLGYGASFTAERPMRIAIVAAGYADGLMRAARAGGYAFAGGARCALLIVNMDICAIELGEAPSQVGDQVELLGPNALLDDLATSAGTVAHELLTRLSHRAQRAYLGER
jgi:alanine racemase